MDCSPPGSSVHGIFQARILEWVAISFSRKSSPPRDRTWVSCIVDRCFTVWATRKDSPVQFNHSTYSWEQIKFHLHDNASLNVQLLQKKIFKTFSKRLPSSTNLETLAEQIIWARPRRWFQSITHSVGFGTVTSVIVLIIVFVVYCCLSIRLVNTNQAHLVRTFSFLFFFFFFFFTYIIK